MRWLGENFEKLLILAGMAAIGGAGVYVAWERDRLNHSEPPPCVTVVPDPAPALSELKAEIDHLEKRIMALENRP